MKYKITLKPLQPFLFGGDNTYGKIGDKENGTYITKSRLFPQQSAILGMLKKEIMTQQGLLTKKIKGEWVDKNKTTTAHEFVGLEKFNIFQNTPQNFGKIKKISPIFIEQNNQIIIKKANIKSFPIEKNDNNFFLKNFTSKFDIFDNFETLDGNKNYKTTDIFKEINQTLNQKNASENSLYKKTSYMLEKGFSFVFFLECDCEIKGSIITLGADKSSFIMEVESSTQNLDIKTSHLILLSDSYISLPLEEHCDFAITSEISYQNLTNIKGIQKNKKTNKNSFSKSKKVYLYEKGSVIIGAKQSLIDNINNPNLQQIGYNTYTLGENK
ncbi:hypothetical protein [Arcobacter ellisii]|uniref:CRISPR/Cas system-associated RAMP protein Cmr3, type III-B n=1 Tax=Arcobacter ellisii TaxID=913109 RepID=A0A347UAJ3_9BACT|nr:hypothetical protein [Arcobacter ellisii]AXX95871.1 CRISPR/Cas system-associated RAMP protein Cmr3, type III-B [Arcobacter ellisii]RXI29731.1 hypothetical protein CP962_10200 [Arcobacter ellisii]